MKISKLTILVLLSLLVLPYGGLIQSLQISPAHAATPWCDASWTNRRTITIDSANVDAALTNFPLLVDLSSLSLTNATTSFFTEKSTCSKLDWELEGPNNAWVKVPSISDSIDTTLYIYYNNSVASNQTNPTGVWDSHYKGVWHLNEDATDEATSTTHTDSTSNSNHGTQSGNASSTGKIANAQDFDGTNDYVDVSDSTSLRPTTLTISTWVKPNSSQGTYARIVSKGKNGARDYNIGKQGSVLAFFYYSSGLHLWDTDTAWSTLVPNDTWTHIVVTYTSGDGSSLKMYVNGVNEAGAWANGTGNSALDFTTEPLKIGASVYSGVTAEYFKGIIDDVRISNQAASASQIAFEYKNQSGLFSTTIFGNEETVNTPPTGLNTFTVDNVSTSSITTSWSAVTDTNFNHYEFWHGPNQADVLSRSGTASEWDDSDDASLSSINTTSTTISTSLPPNVPYYVKMWAIDDEDAETTITDEQIQTLANVPSGLTITNGSVTELTANWDANGNPAGTEFFAENIPAGTNSGWTTLLSWISSGLTAGTDYSFMVKARNASSVETTTTSTVIGTTDSPPPPPISGGSIIPFFVTNPTVPNGPVGGGPIDETIFDDPTPEPDDTPPIPIEIIALDLVGVSPINIHCSELTLIQAGDATFEFYIENPDGSVRDMNSAFARVEDLGNGETKVSFEDKGSDFDFNDVVVLLRNMVDHFFIDVLTVDAAWHHALGIRVLVDDTIIDDFLLFEDTHESVEIPSAVSFICEG